MRIIYESEKVGKYFFDWGLAQSKLNDKTRTVKKHINYLIASPNFQMFLSLGLGKPHRLCGDLDKCYGISITGNYRLIVRPNCQEIDSNSLKNCDTVIVKGVVDYHGGKYNWIIP